MQAGGSRMAAFKRQELSGSCQRSASAIRSKAALKGIGVRAPATAKSSLVNRRCLWEGCDTRPFAGTSSILDRTPWSWFKRVGNRRDRPLLGVESGYSARMSAVGHEQPLVDLVRPEQQRLVQIKRVNVGKVRRPGQGMTEPRI